MKRKHDNPRLKAIDKSLITWALENLMETAIKAKMTSLERRIKEVKDQIEEL